MDAATIFAEPIKVLRDRADEDTLAGIAAVSKQDVSLADLIRLGSTVTEQATGTFGNGAQACALSAAFVAGKANEVF